MVKKMGEINLSEVADICVHRTACFADEEDGMKYDCPFRILCLGKNTRFIGDFINAFRIKDVDLDKAIDRIDNLLDKGDD